METRNFAWALGQAKAGKRIFRRGWNGAGQWVCFMPGTTIPEGDLVADDWDAHPGELEAAAG